MAKARKSRKGLIITFTSIFIVLAVVALVFFVYVGSYYKASERAKAYLASTDTCEVVQEDDYITFQPKNQIIPTHEGFIFYPGGKVEYTAYAPLLSKLADNGITSILCKMPFNLAVFNSNAADDKQALYPDISSWYIGGHSLGGAMASSYLSSHEDEYLGLVLLGAYSTKDMSSSSLHSLSITASNDQILNWDKYEEYKTNLPNLSEISVDGGIHSYFGDYGLQNGDGEATITLEEQEDEIVTAITAFCYLTTIESLLS